MATVEQGGNGDWTEQSTNLGTLIQEAYAFAQYTTPHSGNWAALMGVENGEISRLSQTIPDNRRVYP